MQIYIKLGRITYAIGMAGMATLQFFFPGFRPVFIPSWPTWLPNPQVFIYLLSVALIVCSAFIAFDFKGRKTSLILGRLLLLLLVVFHTPFRLANNPESLGSWTDDFKILALAGGAFVIAGSFSLIDQSENSKSSRLFQALDRLVPPGKIFFGVMMFIFGIDHFLYDQFVVTLVPEWIPFPMFWTYFAAIALIGSGISFITGIKIRLVAWLTAIMLFLWFLILHIPRAIAMPELANGNEITSVFQVLAFSGVALIIAYPSTNASANNHRSRWNFR